MLETPVRLLLVEDDPELCAAVARTLRREGLQVTAAPTCASARVLTCRFDVGVFDIGLPDGDGIELAESLLEQDRVGRALFFTAVSRSPVIRRALRVGPLVPKQDGVEAVAQVVLGLLGRGAVTRSGFVTYAPPSAADEPRSAKKRDAG